MDQWQLDNLLIKSAIRGHLDEVKQALQQGANVNAKDWNNETVLFKASERGYTDIVQYLLEVKADPDIPDIYGSTPLITAAASGQSDVIDFLLKYGVNIHHTTMGGNNALHVSSAQGHIEVVKVLLKHQENIEAVNADGNTPLMLACKRGSFEVVNLLLDKGANPSVINNFGWTALHFAASNNHQELLEVLNSNGADINAVTKYGNTPLMIASKSGYHNVAELLLEQGANVTALNKYDWTALHFAADNNHPEIIKILVSNGADISAVNKNGKTPAEVALSRGYHDIAKQMIDEALQGLVKRGLHKGNVQLTNMRLVLMGPPCVGKTSFMSLLLNWNVPKFHNSTALATRPIRALERVAGHIEGKIWEKVTSLDLLRMLSDAIQALEQDPQQKTDDPFSDEAREPVTSIESPHEVMTGETDVTLTRLANKNVESHSAALLLPTAVTSTTSISDSKKMDSAVVTSIKTENEIDIFTTIHISSSNGLTSSNKTTGTSIASTSPENELSSYNSDMKSDPYTKELVNILAKQRKRKDRHKATWIDILDSGGQPQFADVSRAFIRGNTINIICTKLTESLFEKPQFCYSLKGKLLNQPSDLQMNNLQLIEHFVCSIVSSKNANVKGKKKLPVFMIIGTYYDKIKHVKKELYEPLEFKNEQLLSTLSEFHDHFIFHNDDPKELIFPVDNLCWWNRKKISSSLRQHIMSYQKDIGINAPIPVRWYMFELRLKEEASQEEHGMVSLESSCSIGVSLGMDEKDVLKSLSHLHFTAMFLYFSNVLRNVIFTNPQYLLDMLSSLIRVSFVDSLEDILLEGKSIAPDIQRAFREFGVFDECLLDNVCLPFVSSLFTKYSFLLLLQYLHIITPLSTTDGVKRYFMPVVLSPKQANEKDIVLFQKKCDPMIIAFRSKVVPQGVFPAVVVALVDRTDSPQFDIDSCSVAFPRQLRYAILLYSEDLFGSVLLVDRFYWIEVYYNGLTKNCFKLRKVICEAISACTDILAYDEGILKAEVTIPCKQEHRESGHKLHPVIISWDNDPPLMRCSIEKQLPTLELIDERQTCWLIDPCSVSSVCKTIKQQGPEMFDISSLLIAKDSDLIPVSSNLPNGPLDECHLSTLVKFVKDVDDWEMLGIHLGVKDAVIKDIKVLNHFQPAPSRKDMLVKWLKSGCAKRADFIEALKAIDENLVVQEILLQNDKDETGDIPLTITETMNDITK